MGVTEKLLEKIARLENEADWLADELGPCLSALCRYNRDDDHPNDGSHCVACWRERARRDDFRWVPEEARLKRQE